MLLFERYQFGTILFKNQYFAKVSRHNFIPVSCGFERMISCISDACIIKGLICHCCVSQTGVEEQSGDYLTASSAFGSLTVYINTGVKTLPLNMLFPC